MNDEDAAARRWAAVYAERGRLLRVARRRTLNEAEAEDCVSEAMLRCMQFEDLDEERLPAFLTTVTVRLCADQHRDRVRLLRAGGRVAGRDEPGPEDGVCDRAEAAWLAEHVVALPTHQQRIVEARATGLSCAAAARELGVSVDAVKSAVNRVRNTLRAARVSACGMWPALTGKLKLVGATVAGGALVVGATVGGLVHFDPPHGAPAAARLAGGAPPVVEIERAGGQSPAEAEVASPTAPPRDRAYPTPHLTPGPTDPSPSPTGTEIPVAGPVTVTSEDDEYSMQERLMQCVTEGLRTTQPYGCKKPGE